MGGYDGLALSLYDKNAQTFTDDGAHNFFSITITDATTITSGYIQPFYASITTTGSITTGNAQVAAFAADMFIGGTLTSELAGLYIYQAASGSPTVTSANVNGVVVYMDDLGAAPAYRAGVKVYSDAASTSIGSSLDGAFTTVSANTGCFGSMLAHKGETFPNYFLWLQNTGTGGMMYPAADTTATIAAGLKVNFGGAIYFIPMYASTCTD